MLTGGDGKKAAGAPGTTTTTPSTPSTLLSVLAPTQIAATCTAETPGAGAVETDACVPTEGATVSDPDSFRLSFFPNAKALETAYSAEKARGRVARCGSTTGERVWIHTETGKRGGRRVCLTEGNEFVVVWTHEKLGSPDHVDMLGVARKPGRSPTIFRSWWQAVNDNIGKCRPKVAEETCLATIDRLSRAP